MSENVIVINTNFIESAGGCQWKGHNRSTTKQHDGVVQLLDNSFILLDKLLSADVADKHVYFATGHVCKSQCVYSKFVYKLDVTEDEVVVDFNNIRTYKFILNCFGDSLIVSRLPNIIEGD